MVELEVEDGRIEGAESFFLTDNYVEEDIYYRGNSSNMEILS